MPSVANLPPALSINGTTVFPTFRYNGKDASAAGWPAWGYGATLALQSGTAPEYSARGPLHGSPDAGVLFKDGGYFKASDTGLGDTGTDDFVIEAVFRADVDAATYNIIFSKIYTGGSQGIDWGLNGANLYMWLNGTAKTDSATLVDGKVYHAIMFADRSGSAVWYVNGVAGTAADISALSGSTTHANAMCIGCTSQVFSNPYGSAVYYCALWHAAAWMDTHLQATVAAQRYAALNISRAR